MLICNLFMVDVAVEFNPDNVGKIKRVKVELPGEETVLLYRRPECGGHEFLSQEDNGEY